VDIVWPAIGICLIVCVVFYALAMHWHRILQHQSWMVRKLADRVQVLEEMRDPQFRRRVGENAPPPLEQVFTFSFRLSEHFWRTTLALTDEDWNFIRSCGSFVGSVKLECWRSHTVATITEVLPESKTARWETRSLDFYPDAGKAADALTLWELRLSRPQNGSAVRPPSLALVLRQNALELCGRFPEAKSPEVGVEVGADEEARIFRVPLNVAELTEFRSQDPSDNSDGMNANSASNGFSAAASSWRAFYSHVDETMGFEWQLWSRDLAKKAEWEHWKILEPMNTSLISREQNFSDAHSRAVNADEP
jgi:hypothetical protein